MKKLLILILSVIAAFTAIISLTACDNKPSGNGGTTITDGDKSNDDNNGGSGDGNSSEYSKNLRYELNNDKTGYILTGIGLCEDVDIVMPSFHNNLPVIGIGERAFYLNKQITDIIISDSVQSIGGEAFSDCASLVSVTIGNGVTSIGGGAFYGCHSLENVVIGNSVTNMGYGAFYGCRSLKNVVIGNSVTSIGDMAFSRCTSLENVVIGNSVTSIGGSAFQGCSSLTVITIGNGVTSIMYEAFHDCGLLTKIYYSGDVNDWVQIDGLYWLMNYGSSNKELYMSGKLLTEAVVDTTTEIKNHAFYNYTSLVSVTIGNGVMSIGYRAFEGCASLKYNEYNNAYYLGNDENDYVALIKAKSTDITSCKINEACKVIGTRAFEDCASLTSITITDSVASIGGEAFFGCTSLESVTIGNGVTDIGIYALRLRSLANISVNENNKNYKSIDGNLYSKDGKTLIQYAIGKTDTSFIIPDGVTNIGDMSFYGCRSLKNVVIGNSVTSIGDMAFSDCYLKNITIPDSVERIGDSVFAGCGSLKYNEYGNALYLGNDSNPFVILLEPKTYDITSCEINGSCKIINSGALTHCKSLTNISVDENNKNYKSINGNLYSKDGKTLIQYAIGKTDTAFNIPDSVTSIGDGAFYCCSSLANITIGDGVTSIGDMAFSACWSLMKITIGNGVLSIGAKVFCGSFALETINYRGTEKQWDSIKKDSNWNEGMNNYPINYNYVEK